MKPLPFTVVRQGEMNRWCWAAVTAGIWNCYNGPKQMSMCDVVTQVRGEPCCNPVPGHCHTERELDVALNAFEMLREPMHPDFRFGSAVEDRRSNAKIRLGRPVGVGLSFGTFMHFCVVYGRDPDASLVCVADSLFDNAPDRRYVDLRDNYRNKAAWVTTYLTRKPL
jgi:hypothetical protein